MQTTYTLIVTLNRPKCDYCSDGIDVELWILPHNWTRFVPGNGIKTTSSWSADTSFDRPQSVFIVCHSIQFNITVGSRQPKQRDLCLAVIGAFNKRGRLWSLSVELRCGHCEGHNIWIGYDSFLYSSNHSVSPHILLLFCFSIHIFRYCLKFVTCLC